MIYQIPVDQITGLAKYGLALSCTAVSDLAESVLAKYSPPSSHDLNFEWIINCLKRGDAQFSTIQLLHIHM